jgi:hypothetical protein
MTEPVVPSTPTTLPAAPDPTTASSTFDSLAYAFTVAQNPWATSINLLGTQTYTNAVAAKEKADIAVTQAGVASSQANNASASAVLAESWATSTGVVSGGLYGARKYAQDAATSAGDAAAIIGSFLGEKLSDPLLNNQGGPLVGGNWYVNVAPGSEAIRVYTGTGWIAGISAVAGVSSINGMTGNVSFTVPAGKLYYMGTA